MRPRKARARKSVWWLEDAAPSEGSIRDRGALHMRHVSRGAKAATSLDCVGAPSGDRHVTAGIGGDAKEEENLVEREAAG